MQASDFAESHLDTLSVYLSSERDHSVHESGTPTQDYHVFFLTGNPGCIEYYHDFLAILFHSLSNSPVTQRAHARFSVYGHSLANFIDYPIGGSHPGHKVILSLQDQIRFVVEKLRSYVEYHRRKEREKEDVAVRSDSRCRVILVGHSVGTWMSMEILSRVQTEQLAVQGLHIVGMVALFPTITRLAQSPSGLRFGRLARLFFLPRLLGTFSYYLTLFLPRQVLQQAVKLITGFPDIAANTTTTFLSSSHGVEQALYASMTPKLFNRKSSADDPRSMAGDEMREIADDKWDQSVWGATQHLSGTAPPKLFFFFGENDHWVANHVRDELIAARGFQGNVAESWKPKMVVDHTGIPHSFCIRHSAVVAETVLEYIEEMLIT